MRRLRLVAALILFFLIGSLVTWAVLEREGGDVAVVRIEGGIFDPEPTVRQLEELRKGRVPAVVLRVDSPGGSVSASQEIYDAVKKLSEKKKVVASLGVVAASGGYYVALPAARILANPGTITGSIGVRMELVNLEELVQWARLKPEILKSGRLKDLGSPFRPMTDEERTLLKSILEEMHGQFKEAVASARGLSIEEVERLADGRVYTGAQAVSLRLIDGIGSLQDAIETAGELVGIEEPRPYYPQKPRGRLLEYLIETATRGLAEAVLERQWRVLYD